MPGIDFLLFVRHEAANEIGDFIGGGVEGEGASKQERSVPFDGSVDVTPVGFVSPGCVTIVGTLYEGKVIVFISNAQA